MKNVIMDHAGSLTYVTDTPSAIDALAAALDNPNIPSVNIAYVTDLSVDELEESSAYPVTLISFALLESYNRPGCQYDECHNLAQGAEYKSQDYCDDHAGRVEDSYADVTVIWEGSVSTQDTCYSREEILKIVADTEKAVAEARAEGNFNEEYGVRVEASFHVHEFDTREEYEAFEGDCWCESYDTEYDSTKDEPGENGRSLLVELNNC